jgi:hypothetical protein
MNLLALTPVVTRRRSLAVLSVVGVLAIAGCGGGGTESPDSDADTDAHRHSQTTSALSNPGICDTLKGSGITPGLLGLCVAYCQALNCPDASAGAAAMSAQCKTADSQLLANYNKLKMASDPGMPCVQPPSTCPCWTGPEIAKVGFAFTPHLVDLFSNVFSSSTISVSSLALVENRYPATDDFPYGAYQVAEVDQNSQAGDRCFYAHADFAPGAPQPTVRSLPISPGEVNACRVSVNAQVGLLRTSGVQMTCSGNACPP